MADFYYVIKHASTGKYLADSFYHLQWTDHLGKAKRFTQAGAQYAACKSYDTKSVLVHVCEIDETQIEEAEIDDNTAD